MIYGSRDAGGQGVGRPAARDLVLLLVSAGGLSFCITLVFLGMRAVMDIGGACASGGPYVPVQPCPDGVTPLMLLGIFGLFGFGGLGFYAGAKVGGPWALLPALAWPGLFLSLGWNFLEFGFSPPGDGGWEWSWLFCGAIFVAMGGIPLVFAWSMRADIRSGNPEVARRFGLPVIPGARTAPFEPPPSLAWDPSDRFVVSEDRTTGDAAAGRPAANPGEMVDRLERLAHLRRSGDISNEEYEIAKRALLGEDPGPAS